MLQDFQSVSDHYGHTGKVRPRSLRWDLGHRILWWDPKVKPYGRTPKWDPRVGH